MRVISFCADSVKDAADKGLYQWLQGQDADFICIQGLGCSEDELREDLFFPDGYNAYFFDSADGKSGGVAIYCRMLPKAIMTGLGSGEFDMEGRYIQADYSGISIGCLLVPPGGNGNRQTHKTEFLGLLRAHLTKISNKRREYIMCGGWNLAHTSIDVEDPDAWDARPGFLAEEQQWLDEVLKIGYVDAFRDVSADTDEFTWWPEGEGNGLRTDFQLVSMGLKKAIDYGTIYKSQTFSSHAPVIMDYDLESDAGYQELWGGP